MAKHTKASENPASTRYGGWDFARDFSTQFFALLNTGRIFPALLVLLALLMLLFGVRMPTEELAPLSNHLLDALSGWTGVFFLLLVVTNCGWMLVFHERDKLHQQEIKRLTDIRSQLMHGGDMTLIKEHRSSDGEQQEGYLLPSQQHSSREGGSP